MREYVASPPRPGICVWCWTGLLYICARYAAYMRDFMFLGTILLYNIVQSAWNPTRGASSNCKQSSKSQCTRTPRSFNRAPMRRPKEHFPTNRSQLDGNQIGRYVGGSTGDRCWHHLLKYPGGAQAQQLTPMPRRCIRSDLQSLRAFRVPALQGPPSTHPARTIAKPSS